MITPEILTAERIVVKRSFKYRYINQFNIKKKKNQKVKIHFSTTN